MADISPAPIVDAILGYQQTAALKAALDLDLFSEIARGADTADVLAQRTGSAVRGIRILCDYLVVRDFLTKDRDRYGLAPGASVFLDRNSPAWLGSIVEFLAAPEMMALYLDDASAFVRNGGSAGLANIAPDNPLWVTFARAMAPFMAPVARGVAAEAARFAPRRVLDLAAGHGLYGIEVAKAVPEAEVTAVDWQSVLELARENAASAGVAERYRVLPGSAFDVDWGTGYDLVLLANFLHHFDRDACVGLLGKVRRSLAGSGCALAVDFVPNEDRVSPPFPAMFSFTMLATTPKGEAFTAREVDEMGRAAGFARVSVAPIRPTPESLVLFE